MKNILKFSVLGCALLASSAAPVQASQLQFFVTVSALETAISAAALTWGGNCTATLSNCGIYGIGLVSDTVTSGSNQGTTGAFQGINSPAPSGTDQWVSTATIPVPPASNVSGMEAGPGSTVAFISTSTKIGANSNTYTANTTGATQTAASTAQTGAANLGMFSAGTQLGFVVNFGATNILVGQTETIVLELLATVIDPTTGAEGAKNLGAQVTLTGVTLQATPEPSSIVLVFGGLAALAFGRFRRVRG